MASKSRLGKGLGALFPDLPGDTTLEHGDVASGEPVVGDAAEVTQRKLGRRPRARRSEPSVPSPSKTGDVGSVQPDDVDVSRETARTSRSSKKLKRGSIPPLNAMTNPSNAFFNTDMGIAGRSGVGSSFAGGGTAARTGSTEGGSPSSPDQAAGAADAKLRPVQGGYLAELGVAQIAPNAYQPRTVFDEDELKELSDSIQQVGVLQPIVVRRRQSAQPGGVARPGDRQNGSDGSTERTKPEFELIMGERRWRASQIAGLQTIPAIVKTSADDDDMLRDALLENLHRVALNPLEEAAAYQQMIEEFGLTQVQLSQSVSKSRPQIANTLRLLNLPTSVQKKVASGVLSAGHARALLGLAEEKAMEKLADRIIAEGLSVRSTEEIVAMESLKGSTPKTAKPKKSDPWANSPVQQGLEDRFETKVAIKGSQQRGRIEIVFSSHDDMQRILSLLMPAGGAGHGSGWV